MLDYLLVPCRHFLETTSLPSNQDLDMEVMVALRSVISILNDFEVRKKLCWRVPKVTQCIIQMEPRLHFGSMIYWSCSVVGGDC